MHFVYVIESINFKKRYVGLTINIENRLKEHNAGKTTSNKAFRPYKLIYSEKVDSVFLARKREKYLKSAAGRSFLKKILAP